MPLRPRVWPYWIGLAVAIAFLDLWAKHLVQVQLTYQASVAITSFFNLVHARNTGAAFSLFADAGGVQRYFLIVIALAASVWLSVMLIRGRTSVTESLGFSLILGGAMGNAIDRWMRGYVTDFLDFHWHGWHWATFNVADVAITLGVASLLVGAFILPVVKPR